MSLATPSIQHLMDDIGARLERGGTITVDEALTLLTDAPLAKLGQLANEVKRRHNPEDRITFVIDSNPNYTNVCDADCTFCAFYRHPDDDDAYTLSVDEVLEQHVKLAKERGATTVLLQGGLNDAIPWEFYPELVRRWVAEYPDVHPHLFSAPEIFKMHEITGQSFKWVMQQLYDAGLRTMPGGGAEILVDRVRKKFSTTKVLTQDWLDIHRAAHEVGMKTTATMMYGHVETDADIIEHLDVVRQLQADTGGFTAFIPWSFKPGNTPLEKKIPHDAGPVKYLRVLAVARIFLHNVPHIQSSWFSEGKKTGQTSLLFGADDFGGTLVEENVLKAANFWNQTNTVEVIHLIQDAGFKAAQRTTLYEILDENCDAADFEAHAPTMPKGLEVIAPGKVKKPERGRKAQVAPETAATSRP